MTETGRPEYSDDQYHAWLAEMAPFLQLGNSMNYAIQKALLSKHKSVIYEKYRLNDWFSEKIDAFQEYPGEIVNSIFTRLVLTIDEKLKRGQVASDEEWRNLRFFAEKHKSCQPFFSPKQEVGNQTYDPVSIKYVLDGLEYDNMPNQNAEVARQAKLALEEQLRTQTAPSPTP